MKNLNIILLESGLTVKARLVDHEVDLVRLATTLLESNVLPGHYYKSITSNLADGSYLVQFYTEINSEERLLGTGTLHWKDGEEVTPLKHYNEDIKPTIM